MLMESFRRYVAVSGGQEALAGGLGELGRGHGTGLRPAEDAGVHRGGQAGVVERRGAQGVVGEGGEGGTDLREGTLHAGMGADREV